MKIRDEEFFQREDVVAISRDGFEEKRASLPVRRNSRLILNNFGYMVGLYQL